MEGMFLNCNSLNYLLYSNNFNIKNETKIMLMLYNCNSLVNKCIKKIYNDKNIEIIFIG